MKKICFILIISFLYSFDAQAIINDIPAIAKYNKPNTYQIPDHVLNMYEKQLPAKDRWLVDSYKKEVELLKNPILVDTIFHFVSASVPLANISNTLTSVNKLKSKYPDLEYRNIYEGISGDSIDQIKELNRYMNEDLNDSGSFEHFYMKIDFNVFRKFNITKAPALAFAQCNKRSIYPSDCEIKYLVRGDIKLDYFFSLIGEDNSSLKEYYFELIEN
ncbi:MAG: Unknown protein [uncultured Campylobacterales bacterium]|uniref:Uncharacterized protein n=1 Tax=uncultured Campylobacterales bacterium TaxID=352960 RepID=A0A6S6TG29_9BACT|nr:MAG: Unknown protein [uncultured Campylobacterales bacterium]